jgi:hypothetical protein
MTHEPEHQGEVPERFEYFMVRLTRSAHAPDRLAGLIERLGFGEKRSFDTGEQLLKLVSGGFADEAKMQPVPGPRNAPAPTSPSQKDGF